MAHLPITRRKFEEARFFLAHMDTQTALGRRSTGRDGVPSDAAAGRAETQS